MRRQDSLGVRTPEDLEKKYLSQLLGIKKAMSSYDESIKKTNNTLENFTLHVLDNLNNLQNQIDGNITTYFYSGVPSINSLPTSEWNNEDYEKHLGDLYYDKSTGYAYRFSFDDDYCWIKLSDTDVVEALALANSAKDTADSKRRTFVEEPIPPYDVGDIWFSNGKLYRCKISNEQGSFQSEHWIKAVDYTDDTAANDVKNLLNEFKQEVIRDFLTQSSFTTAIDKINASVKQLEVAVGANNKIFREEPTVPYNKGDIYINGSNIYTCIQDRNEGTYNISDWEISDNPSEIISEAALKIALGLIEQSVKEKIGNEEIGSVISQTAQKIFIESNNFGWKSKFSEMTTEGKLSVWDIVVNGGKIILEDFGINNPSIIFKKKNVDLKDLEYGVDLSSAILFQNFWEYIEEKPDRIETVLPRNFILITDNKYRINYKISSISTPGGYTMGWTGELYISKSDDASINDVIYRGSYYYTDENYVDEEINYKEYQLPSDFGKIIAFSNGKSVKPDTDEIINFLKKAIIVEDQTTYSSDGIVSKIYSTSKYNSSDLNKAMNYIVNNISLSNEDFEFLDANEDGKINVIDILSIIKNGGDLNISDQYPGNLIIDYTNPRKTVRLVDKDNNIITSMGLDGLFVMVKDNYYANKHLINIGESLSYKTNLETECGVWVDGKKIYRLVMNLDSNDTGDYSSTIQVPVPANIRIDILIKLEGYIYNTNNCWCPINFPYSEGKMSINAHYSNNSNQIQINSHWAFSKGFVILNYTKKEDE